MKLPVIFPRQATIDVEQAADWFDEQRLGLGREFIAALERKFELIAEYPEICPKFRRSLRRALIHRFRYAVTYRVHKDAIEIVAVLHFSRHPNRL